MIYNSPEICWGTCRGKGENPTAERLALDERLRLPRLLGCLRFDELLAELSSSGSGRYHLSLVVDFLNDLGGAWMTLGGETLSTSESSIHGGLEELARCDDGVMAAAGSS